MARINLLDWRQEKREKRQRNFLGSLAFTALIGGAVLFGMHSKVNGDISFQQSRNARLKSEISAIEKQIKEIRELEKVKQALLARMRVIEQLQRSRTEIVHFFDELVTTVPDGLYVTKVAQSGRTTTVDGVAESNGRISTYIRNLDNSDWFTNAKLIVIRAQQNNRQRLNNFQLQFQKVQKKNSGEDT